MTLNYTNTNTNLQQPKTIINNTTNWQGTRDILAWAANQIEKQQREIDVLRMSNRERAVKHKHADVIRAWAEGAKIEYFSKTAKEWCFTRNPQWQEDVEYRVAGEPPKKVKKWQWVCMGSDNVPYLTTTFYTPEELQNFKHLRILYKAPWTELEFDE